MHSRKVRIKKLPTAKTGGSMWSGNQVAPSYKPDQMTTPGTEVRDTLPGVPREYANVEAEKGEVVSILNKDGLPANYKVGGKRHSEGGTPLNIEPNNFIFSDTPKIKIKDENLLKEFGETKPKTPAKIAKKYDMNKYRKILDDPNEDKLSKETAEKMIANYNLLLGKLALVQESTKGFPNGVPMIALPYMAVNSINPEDVLPLQAQPDGQPVPQNQMMRRGGDVMVPMVFKGGGQSIFEENPEAYSYGNIDFLNQYGVQQSPQNMLQKPIINKQSIFDQYQAYQNPTSSYNQLNFLSGYGTNASVPQTALVIPQAQTSTSTPIIPSVNTSTGSKPKPVKGSGSNIRKGTYEFNRSFIDPYTEKASAGLYAPQLPMTIADPEQFTRQSLQHKVGKSGNVYGDADWKSGELYTDFVNRHQWFLKDNPDWNPDDMDDVRQFQSAYNEMAKKYGLPEYFKGNTQGTGIDGKYGEHTWSAPGFNAPTKQPEVITPKNEDVASTINAEELNVPQYPTLPDNWWAQDVVKTWGAVRDAGSLKKYSPWAPQVDPSIPDPVFYDPNRELAANAESASIATNAMAAFAGPQSLNSRSTQVQGQSAKNAADILGKYNNMNVSTANTFETTKSGILNQFNLANADVAVSLWDKATIANQQFDNAKRESLHEIRQSYIDGLTNRAQTSVMNRMYPQYAINPATGGMMFFKGGKNITPTKANSYNPKMQEFAAWKDAYGYLENDQIIALMNGKVQATQNSSPPTMEQFYNMYSGVGGNYPG